MTGRRTISHRVAGAAGALVALLAGGCSAPSATRAVILYPRSPKSDSAPPASATSTTSPPSAVSTTLPSPVSATPGWSSPSTTLPPGGGFTSVSCLSDTFCIATGGGASDADQLGTTGPGLTVSWDGAAWSDPSVYYPAPAAGPLSAPVLPAIACTGGPFCLIVDGTDHVSTGDGTDWSPPTPLPGVVPTPAAPPPGAPASPGAAVACPTPEFCAVVDAEGHAASLVDGKWTTPSSFPPTGTPPGQVGPVSVACPTVSMCRAVVGTRVLDWNGTAWSEEPSPWTTSLAPGAPAYAAVGCPTTDLCAVVSGSELFVDTPGQPWTPLQTIDPEGGLDSISCPSATFCMAADEHGSVLQWDGGSWSAPARVLPAATDYTGDPTTVSCSNEHFCMVMNGDGDFATYTEGGSPNGASGVTAASP